ncbi:hypothetical protein C8F01DRAFT_636111 [Mycena amicta]|nr:hypothetical protein C8F01DRAFT_636111 [Mycena amicta]
MVPFFATTMKNVEPGSARILRRLQPACSAKLDKWFQASLVGWTRMDCTLIVAGYSSTVLPSTSLLESHNRPFCRARPVPFVLRRGPPETSRAVARHYHDSHSVQCHVAPSTHDEDRFRLMCRSVRTLTTTTITRVVSSRRPLYRGPSPLVS